jgi:hypothetical protein
VISSWEGGQGEAYPGSWLFVTMATLAWTLGTLLWRVALWLYMVARMAVA